MSGGAFDYKQYNLEYIADEIDKLIETNDKKDEYGYSRSYSPQTLEKFKEAARTLRLAGKMAHRIDWLVSGDDGEESFHKRWEEEIKP